MEPGHREFLGALIGYSECWRWDLHADEILGHSRCTTAVSNPSQQTCLLLHFLAATARFATFFVLPTTVIFFFFMRQLRLENLWSCKRSKFKNILFMLFTFFSCGVCVPVCGSRTCMCILMLAHGSTYLWRLPLKQGIVCAHSLFYLLRHSFTLSPDLASSNKPS